jgi:hypothetical protein
MLLELPILLPESSIMLPESSVMLPENIYSTGSLTIVTYDCQNIFMLKATGAWRLYYKAFTIIFLLYRNKLERFNIHSLPP